jgi:hypothetical protein
MPRPLGNPAFRGAPNQPESASRSAGSAVPAGSPVAAAQGEVGREGAGQLVLAGHRVADVGAGDESRDAARWLLVVEQLRE